jgi:hypothetical protein
MLIFVPSILDKFKEMNQMKKLILIIVIIILSGFPVISMDSSDNDKTSDFYLRNKTNFVNEEEQESNKKNIIELKKEELKFNKNFRFLNTVCFVSFIYTFFRISSDGFRTIFYDSPYDGYGRGTRAALRTATRTARVGIFSSIVVITPVMFFTCIYDCYTKLGRIYQRTKVE